MKAAKKRSDADAEMEKRVLAAIGAKSQFAALCKSLPYGRDSVTDALQRLKRKGKVRRGMDDAGEFWRPA